MLHHHVVEVSMESTSVYWIPVWRVLSPYFKLNLANPYFIKQIPGRKSDVKDAQWIAECTMKEFIRGSFVPPEIIQQLRQYDRRIFDLNEEIVRKLSKLDAVLQRCNIRLSNYVSNVYSKIQSRGESHLTRDYRPRRVETVTDHTRHKRTCGHIIDR